MAKTNNPKTVVDAIVQSDTTIGKVTLHPITILRYAWLEKLHSPFIDSTKEFNVSTIAPTIYILTASKEQLRACYSKSIEEIEADAIEWADENLTIDDLPAMIKTVIDQFAAINKAAPTSSASSDPKKK